MKVPKIAASSRQNLRSASGQKLPTVGRPTSGSQPDDGARTAVSLLPSYKIIRAVPPSIILRPGTTTRYLCYVPPLSSLLGTLTTIHLIHHPHHPCHCHVLVRPSMFHLSYLMRKIPLLFLRTRIPHSVLRHTTPRAIIHIAQSTFLLPRMSFPPITLKALM